MVGQLDRARPGTQLRGSDGAAFRRPGPGGRAPRLRQPHRATRATLRRLVRRSAPVSGRANGSANETGRDEADSARRETATDPAQVSETRRNVGDQEDVRRSAHNPATSGQFHPACWTRSSCQGAIRHGQRRRKTATIGYPSWQVRPHDGVFCSDSQADSAGSAGR
jgi:hypothetical protein